MCVCFVFFFAPARLNLLQLLRPGDVDVALIMYDMAGFSPGAMQLLVDPRRPRETQNTLGAWRNGKKKKKRQLAVQKKSAGTHLKCFSG